MVEWVVEGQDCRARVQGMVRRADSGKKQCPVEWYGMTRRRGVYVLEMIRANVKDLCSACLVFEMMVRRLEVKDVDVDASAIEGWVVCG